MAASSASTGQIKYGLRDDSDGLRIALAGGAFDMIILSASTFVASSSSGAKQTPFDVFINHCGQDVKPTLASRIWESLNSTGLKVFLDKHELKYGDLLPKALEEAMSTASIYIAIFSEHYAQSPWCLAELEYMVKTRKLIVPVFYHVQPSVLRWADGGKGTYADAFSEHEKKKRYAPGVLQQWKEALQQVSLRIGGIINNIGDEQRTVNEVVNRVMNEMKKVPLQVAKHPVGLQEAVQDFESTIALDHQSVGSTKTRTVGIWGMGGSGKTTLAKEIFNQRHSSMHWSSFLSDIRDAHPKGLLKKQKTLLKDLDPKDGCSFDNLDEGKQILKNRLSRSVPVLIVLDDVDHIDQLDDLLPPKESLGDKSLIIVTTRNKNVLQQWGVSDSAIYQMKTLNPIHAKQLFCWHAFLRNSPPPEFEDLVQKFLKACDGLPLSLKVLGGQLCGNSGKDYWEDTLKKYSEIPHRDIKNKLKVSYDALDKEEQEMFLDAACLFIGQTKSAAIAAWDAEFYGRLGWDTLIKKCLVEEEEVGEEVLIRMHDHLRDLGRDIANEQPAHRLWSPHQVIKITSQQESLRVRGIAKAVGDNCYHHQGKIVIKTTNQEECSLAPPSLAGLKIFGGRQELFSRELCDLSKELIWLQCCYPDLTHLPWPALKKLRVLELYYGCWRTQLFYGCRIERLWAEDADVPSELRELVIRGCPSFAGFPRSIDHVTYLKRIVINTTDGIFDNRVKSDLPEEFCNLKSLEHLEWTNCTTLSSLPRNFGKLTELRHLNLRGWTNLKALPDSFKNLTLLEYLSLESCRELSMKSELNVLENMTKLRYLNLEGCGKFEDIRLPESVSFTDLHLLGTGLKELPANIFHLSKLTKLEIESEFLTTFPLCVANLCPLTTLTIKGCNKLESLPDSLEHLTLLKYLTLVDTGVKCLPKSLIQLQHLTINCTPLSKLELSYMRSLEELCILDCPELTVLASLSETARTLKEIDLKGCHKLQRIEGLKNIRSLKKLRIYDCPELNGLPGLAELTSLQEIYLQTCHKLRKVEDLRNARALQKFMITHCQDLEALPSLPKITFQQDFGLGECHKLKKIEGLGNIKSLHMLEIYDCQELDGFTGLGELTSLQAVRLKMCPKLEKIDGLENLRSLKHLNICDCGLEKIEGLENLRSLEWVRIYACPQLDGLLSLAELTSLSLFNFGKCPKLKKLEICNCPRLYDLSLAKCPKLMRLGINDCPQLAGLDLSLAEITSLEELKLKKCTKLKKIEGLGNMRSLKTLNISDCLELESLPSLCEITYLEELQLKNCYKVEKIEGLEQLSFLRELRVHTRWEAPCIVSLANSERLRSLDVVANNISAVEPFVSNIQKCWPAAVMICTRAVRDVGFLKSFFQSFSNVSVLDYTPVYEVDSSDESVEVHSPDESEVHTDVEEVDSSDESVEVHSPDESEVHTDVEDVEHTDVEDVDFSDESEGQYSDPAAFEYTDEWEGQYSYPPAFEYTDESEVEVKCLKLSAPESFVYAEATLKCFIIDSHHSDLRFSIQEGGRNGARFCTELGEGKWVWMGVFTEVDYTWIGGDRISVCDRKGENVKDRVEAAWLVMGEKGNIVEAFRQHFQRWPRNDVSSTEEGHNMEQPPGGDGDDIPSVSTHEQRAGGQREGKQPAVPQEPPLRRTLFLLI